jgi:hypothetical protein
VAHLSNFFRGQDGQSLRKALGVLSQQQTLDSVLPSELRGKVRLVSMENGSWLVYVDTGAIAAKLRQMTMTLVTRLQGKGQKHQQSAHQDRCQPGTAEAPETGAHQQRNPATPARHGCPTCRIRRSARAFIRLIRHHGFD